jgi:predicted nucleic acid-binding Zn ribbon protein
MSRRAPRDLTAALGELTSSLAPATTLARVHAVWPSTVGHAIADCARPSAERAGVLTVTCTAAVWAHELKLMEAQLVPRLNAALGADEISELRCRTG